MASSGVEEWRVGMVPRNERPITLDKFLQREGVQAFRGDSRAYKTL